MVYYNIFLSTKWRGVMVSLKGIIFDLDGTLADTFPVIFPAFMGSLEEMYGRKYTEQELTVMFGPSEEGVFQRLAPERWKEGFQLYMDIYEKLSPTHTIRFAGIEKVLDLLEKRHMKKAIVTGKSIVSAHVSLDSLGLSRYFEIVKGGSAEGSIKADCMREVLEMWDIPKQQVAYIGDVASDMRIAREVGVVPLGAAWYQKADYDGLMRERPFMAFQSVGDFLNWLETDHHSG